MGAVVVEADLDGFVSDGERKKRLGQYFTGLEVARLLAALAGANHASSIIDPMVGSGDMLIGALSGGRPSMVGGMEIDHQVFATCAARLESYDLSTEGLVLGSAFSPASLAALPSRSWDLVITNPPYVRYQSTAHAAGLADRIPTGTQVRTDLAAALPLLDSLDGEDMRLVGALVDGYSGLSDLAVPSWILCAGLVKVGGTLAMLVPTTWLTRDYAHPVRYLLHRWFDIKCVVEDGDASWFTDALVRTTLVVAKRVERKDSAFAAARGSGYPRFTLRADDCASGSLVGRLFPGAEKPDAAAARMLRKWNRDCVVPAENVLGARWHELAPDLASLRRAASNQRWFAVVEPDRVLGPSVSGSKAESCLPVAISTAMGPTAVEFVTLGDLGWNVGQGLRTGANPFFYLRAAVERDSRTTQLSSTLVKAPLVLPTDATEVALQRQADLPTGFIAKAGEILGRVLTLHRYALQEDITETGTDAYIPMPDDMAAFIRAASTTNVGTAERPKLIPSLSAVAPNARSSQRAGLPPRFWYHLPQFTNRHKPSLFMARINNYHPRTLVNAGRGAVIDANFSTLWSVAEDALDDYALLALLSSTWSRVYFEEAGTVLGGGALKVEAAQLRRLPVPRLASEVWSSLAVLGSTLTGAPSNASPKTLADVDRVLLRGMGVSEDASVYGSLRAIAADRLAARST